MNFERNLSTKKVYWTKALADNPVLDTRTDSSNFGLLVQKSDTNDTSWARTERFPIKSSEMTKFVSDMSLTNREFSLF